MPKFKCLVLDHDDTVVQSMKTLSSPFFCQELDYFRPGASITLEDYILQCHKLGFGDLCRELFGFTDEEMKLEHDMWMEYILSHIPAPYPGIERIIRRHKEAGGILCVVSHSHVDNILRDYDTHFGIRPDRIYGWELPPEQRKPNPFPLQDIMEQYGVTADEILVVDDMQLACKMAAPLGVAVAYAGWSGMGVEEVDQQMRALCEYAFDTVEALAAFLFEGD